MRRVSASKTRRTSMDMGIAALAVVGGLVLALGGGTVFGFIRGKKNRGGDEQT